MEILNDTKQRITEYIEKIKQEYGVDLEPSSIIQSAVHKHIDRKEKIREVYANNKRLVKIWSKDGRPCYYCNKQVKKNEWTVDHKIPLSRGGSPIKESNLAKSCSPCNNKKGNLTDAEYIYLKDSGKFKYLL